MTPKVKSKLKPKVKTKVRPAVRVSKPEADAQWGEELSKLKVQILWAKVRANRKQLSKEQGKKFDKWYAEVSKSKVIEEYKQDYIKYLSSIKKAKKELRNQPKQLPYDNNYVSGLLTLNEYNAMSETRKQDYMGIIAKNYGKMAFYISGDEDKDIRPTEIVLAHFRKKSEVEKQNQEQYAKTHWVQPLTDAQLHLIAISTKAGDVPHYMNKPLSQQNLTRLGHYKSTSQGYREYLKKISRIEFLKSDYEKKLEPLKKIQEQYQAIGRRLRQSAFRPEQELLAKIKSWGLPIEKIIETPAKGDSSKRYDVKLKFDDGKEAFVEIKDKHFTYGYKLDGEDQEADPNYVMPKKARLVRQHGLKEYMDRNKIGDILDFPEHFLKNNTKETMDYRVIDYEDISALAQSCGVIPYAVFVQLCQYIVKIKPTLEKDKNLYTAIVAEEIINYFDNKVAEHKKTAHRGKYTLAKLYRSQFFKEWTVRHKLEKFFKSAQRLYDTWEDLYKIATAEAKRKPN